MRILVATLAVACACTSTHTLADAGGTDASHADAGPGGADAPPDGAPDAPPGGPPFVYFAGFNGGLAGFHVDRTSGALTALPGTWPDPLGAGHAVVARPDGKFLYVVQYGADGVTTFAIDGATGALTSMGSISSGGMGPTYLTMDPQGRVVWVSNDTSGSVVTFSIDPTTGALSQLGSINVGSMPRGMAVDAQARVLAVVHGTTTGGITMCTLDATTGLPTAVDADPATAGRQDVPAGAYTITAAFDATGTHLYVNNSTASTLGFYTVVPATGQATLVTAPTTSTSPLSMNMAPDGHHLYLAADDGVQIVAIAADGTPTPGASVMPASQRAVAVDPAGTLAFGQDNGGGLTSYAVDASTGALTARDSLDDSTTNGYALALVGF